MVPVIDPERNRAAMHLQVVGDFSRGLPFQTHQNTLDAEHDSRLLVFLGLATKFQQLGNSVPVSLSECCAHINIIANFDDQCRIIYARLYSASPFFWLFAVLAFICKSIQRY